jgi:hypothetical protein
VARLSKKFQKKLNPSQKILQFFKDETAFLAALEISGVYSLIVKHCQFIGFEEKDRLALVDRLIYDLSTTFKDDDGDLNGELVRDVRSNVTKTIRLLNKKG